jgi:hypothetical protein
MHSSMRRTLKIVVLGAACACHALRQSLQATSSTLQHRPIAAAAASYKERSSRPVHSAYSSSSTSSSNFSSCALNSCAHAIEVRANQQHQQQQHVLGSLLQTAARTAAAISLALALLYPGVSSARLEPLPPPKSYGQQMTEAIPIKTVRCQCYAVVCALQQQSLTQKNISYSAAIMHNASK